MKIVINDDGTISFLEEDTEVLEPIDFIYESSEIPEYLVDECELLAKNFGETYFIFDTIISNRIKTNGYDRDDKLSSLLNKDFDNLHKDIYHICNKEGFIGLPSRFSYYDTETKLLDKHKKYKLVIDFITLLTFIPGVNNFGPEYEQSFTTNDVNCFFTIRLSPNLFIKLTYMDYKHGGPIETIFYGFFNKTKIYESIISRTSNEFLSIIRDSKLNKILK